MAQVAEAQARTMPAERLTLADVVKDYPGIRALSDVSFSLGRGEILGLVGHNGAGKSTVSKILAGLERADGGEIRLDGAHVSFRSAKEAISHGVGLVPQRLAIVSKLSVRDNITLGLRTHRLRRPGERADVPERAADSRDRLVEIAEHLGIEKLLNRRAGAVGPATQRLVMIGRTLLRAPRVLILDEPSAAFSVVEVERLFEIVRTLRDRGISVIYVSHRLDEVLALVDRVVAMSQGAVIADTPAASLTKGELADLIAGRHVTRVEAPAAGRQAAKQPASSLGPAALRVAGLHVAPKLRDIEFELPRGEIIGLTGLIGSGRTSLLNFLWGIDGRKVAGQVEVGGKPFHPRAPRDAIRRGIAYVPENRARNSLVHSMTVAQNVTLPDIRSYRRARTPVLSRRREHSAVARMLDELAVRPENAAGRVMDTLSGGNQQKTILARWLLLPVDVFLFDEPTEGVDVGGREDIYRMMRRLAGEGKSVLVSSSDVEEVVDQCRRVLVMREGTIAEVIEGEALTIERVSRACIV